MELDSPKTPDQKGKNTNTIPTQPTPNKTSSYSNALIKDLPKPYTKTNKPKPNLIFDWLANFLITEEMKPNTKLQTKLSFQLFNFLKENLSNFIPGQTSFKYFIRTMAGQRPEFLTELIYQANPDINSDATIHFDLIESTLKDLLLKFTTILFTKMNYGEIFASPITILLHKIQNCLQICLNMTRLHLYLTNNFQTINYTKFSEDFKLRPKRFKIDSTIECIDQEKEYFTISSDLRFNIKVLFNLSKTLFLDNFNILFLKNSVDNLNK